MIGTLSDNEETVNTVRTTIGKRIKHVRLDENTLKFEFDDGSTLDMFDAEPTCCEIRYMVTDDDLNEYEGATLLDFELKDGPDREDAWEHGVKFLDVKTDRGTFQMVNHNEHNGNYGGFLITALSSTSGH